MSMGIIAFANERIGNKIFIADSRGEDTLDNKLGKLLEFLLEDYDEPGNNQSYIKCVWDLHKFSELLFKLMGDDGQKLLMEGGKVRLGDFKLFYVPTKILGITCKVREKIKGNFYQENVYEANIYGLRQYYPNAKPETVYDVAGLGYDLLATFGRMGLYPSKLTSPVGVYEECVLRKMRLPTIFDAPDYALDAYEYAAQIMDREWRTVYQVGHWKEAYDFDIGAAYPSEAMKLVDMKGCAYHHSNSVMHNFDWAVFKGEVTIDAPISPILDKEGIARVGTREDYITSDDLAFINKWGIGSFKMQDAWYLKFNSGACPLSYSMKRLFDWRGGGSLREHLAKMISVGIIGKFQEEHNGGYGDYYNPIFATMITSRVRLKVADFIYRNKLQDNLISVMVDGCLTDKLVQVGKQRAMGEWRLNEPSPALVMSIGYQFTGDKKPAGISYGDMVSAIKEHPTRQEYLGVYMGNLERRRQFDKLPKTGGQLLGNKYQSKPLEVVNE